MKPVRVAFEARDKTKVQCNALCESKFHVTDHISGHVATFPDVENVRQLGIAWAPLQSGEYASSGAQTIYPTDQALQAEAATLEYLAVCKKLDDARASLEAEAAAAASKPAQKGATVARPPTTSLTGSTTAKPATSAAKVPSDAKGRGTDRPDPLASDGATNAGETSAAAAITMDGRRALRELCSPDEIVVVDVPECTSAATDGSSISEARELGTFVQALRMIADNRHAAAPGRFLWELIEPTPDADAAACASAVAATATIAGAGSDDSAEGAGGDTDVPSGAASVGSFAVRLYWHGQWVAVRVPSSAALPTVEGVPAYPVQLRQQQHIPTTNGGGERKNDGEESPHASVALWPALLWNAWLRLTHTGDSRGKPSVADDNADAIVGATDTGSTQQQLLRRMVMALTGWLPLPPSPLFSPPRGDSNRNSSSNSSGSSSLGTLALRLLSGATVTYGPTLAEAVREWCFASEEAARAWALEVEEGSGSREGGRSEGRGDRAGCEHRS